MATAKYDWAAIRRAFVETPSGVSLTELAKQCGAEVNTVWRRSKAENWTMERARFQMRVAEQHENKKVEALAQQGATWDAECMAAARKLLDKALKEMDSPEFKSRDVTAAIKTAQDVGKAALGDSTSTITIEMFAEVVREAIS